MVYTASAPVNALVKGYVLYQPMAAFSPNAWIWNVFSFLLDHCYLMTALTYILTSGLLIFPTIL